MSAAARMRLSRWRKREGQKVLRNIVITSDTVDVLVDAGRLPQWDADNPDAIASAVEKLLDNLETFLFDVCDT